MWILRTVTDDNSETTFRILPGGIKTIGRATGADFIVDAALISRSRRSPSTPFVSGS